MIDPDLCGSGTARTSESYLLRENLRQDKGLLVSLPSSRKIQTMLSMKSRFTYMKDKPIPILPSDQAASRGKITLKRLP